MHRGVQMAKAKRGCLLEGIKIKCRLSTGQTNKQYQPEQSLKRYIRSKYFISAEEGTTRRVPHKYCS